MFKTLFINPYNYLIISKLYVYNKDRKRNRHPSKNN